MRFVLLSSPGSGPEAHWSHAVTAELARALVDGGAEVSWTPVVHDRSATPPPPAGIASFGGSVLPPAPLHRIGRGSDDIRLETTLTKDLRARVTAAVVHIGVGARGSPNLLWIADRMGIAPFAIARASEIVCQRGDLRLGDGQACASFVEPGRCARCCTASWLQRASAAEVQNRLELIVASLQVAHGVLVPSDADAKILETVGVPRRNLQIVAMGSAVGVLAERLLARDAPTSRRSS